LVATEGNLTAYDPLTAQMAADAAFWESFESSWGYKILRAGEIVGYIGDIATLSPKSYLARKTAPLLLKHSDDVAKAGTTVYSVVENGVTKYVGITDDLVARASAHLRQKG